MAASLRKHGKNRKAGFVFATLLALPGLASGQTAEETGVVNLTPALLESRIEQVEASSAYDEPTRSSAADYLRRALVNLETERVHRETAARFEQARADAPQETQRLRSALEAKLARDPLASLKGIESSAARDIEQRLEQERANEAAVKAKLTEIEQKLAAGELRPQAARQRVSEASQEVRIATDRMSSAPPAEEPDIVLEARRWAQQTAAAALRAEMNKLDEELLSHPMRLALLQVQSEEAATNLDRIQSRIRALQAFLSERRREETEQVIAEIDLAGLGAAADSSLVQQALLENQELADELDGLSRKLEEVTTANAAAEERLADTRQRFQNAQQRLEVAGIGQALGRFLGEERRKLPSFGDYRHDARQRESQIAETALRDIQLGEQWGDIRDTDNYVQSLLAALPEQPTQDLRPAIAQLTETRRGLLQQAIALNSNYVRALADYEYTENQRYAVVSDYRDFLAEHLLWVRSHDAIGLSGILGLPGELANFLSPGRWIDTANVFLHEALRSPLQMLAILILLLFWWRVGSLRARLRSTAEKVGKPSEDSFTFTARAVAITLIMTLPWPIFTAVTGYALTNSLQANAASRSAGAALLMLTPLLFILRLFRIFCAPGGVAEGHFRWTAEGVKRLRHQLDILMFALLLPGFALLVAREIQDVARGGMFGQLMFLVLAASMMVFLHRLLRPHTGIVESLRRHTSAPISTGWRWFWITIATVIPVGIAIMAFAGFMYSAGTLLSKLINTTWLIFGLVILRELVVRWLLVIKRRLLLRQALQRREAARAAKEAGDSDTPVSDEHGSIAESPSVDIASLDADTHKLVNVSLVVAAILGIAGIWSSILPALGIFEDITLWHYVAEVGGQQELQSVTLIDLSIAILVIIVTIVAARNVPSLIEIVLRQRQSITSGNRLAFATLARYAIAVIGIGATLSIIGVNWSKLQWLIAALGVGIGFGLQEIVANFISGLIILMERPIRVGDVVTVGDTSGSVARVQIRATTIRTWDRQELLVPNKEFITGRVLNWSLSDEIIRIFFRVGIAYGSDVERALQLIEEAANEHPDVLEDPAPLVTFEEFGDNSLNLGLRCFVPSLDIRLETITSLHRAINRKFGEAGIVIAFPQRDIHLDTASPLEVRILQGVTQEPSA